MRKPNPKSNFSSKARGITQIVLLISFCCFLSAPARGAVVDLTAMQMKMQNRINLNLKDAEVSTVLRLLAEQNSLNMIISSRVTGTISMRLNNVALSDAIQEILNSANAYMVEKNDIIHVYSTTEKALDASQKSAMVTEIITPVFAKSTQLQGVISNFLSDNGKMQLFDDARGDNNKPQKIVITDKPENIEMIKGLVAKLDTETRQVLIQSKIIETGISDSDLTGVDLQVAATLTGSPFEMDSKYAPGGKIRLGTLSMDQFSAVMQMLSSSGKSNILSDVSLATMDGETANIHVGDSIPVGLMTIGAGGGGSVSYGTTGIQEYNVGVNMSVTPKILNDSTVQLLVSPDISQVQGFTSLGGSAGAESKAPIIKKRTANTSIMVKSGETIVIGGLVQEEDVETQKRVPVLSRLPLVGSMFRQKEVSKRKSDLMIFITATVMEKRIDSSN